MISILFGRKSFITITITRLVRNNITTYQIQGLSSLCQLGELSACALETIPPQCNPSQHVHLVVILGISTYILFNTARLLNKISIL